MKSKIIMVLIFINVILVSVSGTYKGKMAFLTIPLVLLINIIFSIYGFSKKKEKLGRTALSLLFISMTLIIIIFINVFPFLTR